MTDKIIISDTTCLIALERIGKLHILKDTFTEILTTQEVSEEFGKQFPDWISIKKVENLGQQIELEKILDKGEASAIALSLETPNSILIIDEKKGRAIATEYHLKIIGTLKVLLKAKEKGCIPSVKEIIKQLEQSNFWFSKPLVESRLKEAHEML